MIGSPLARRAAWANSPTPSGRSADLAVGRMFAQVGPAASIRQAWLLPQVCAQLVATATQRRVDCSQALALPQNPAHEMDPVSGFSTVKSAAEAGFAVRPRANRSSDV